MTDQTAHQPLTDQLLDEIDACVNGPLGSATDFDHTTVAPLVAEVRRLRARVAELEAGIAWRDEERRRWVDVHNLVERAIDKGWSAVDTLDLEAELGPAPVAAVVSPAAGTPGSAR